MTDTELAARLRDHASNAENLVREVERRSTGSDLDTLMGDVSEGAKLLRDAATRIECGNLGINAGSIVHMTNERIWGLAFAAAGAASTPFMRDHPQYVMPTGDITREVTRVLSEMGFTEPPPGFDPTFAATGVRP